MAKNILVVAGEASGDLHAGHLIQQLKAIRPDLSFFGLGGKNMRDAGVEVASDLTELAVVGFFEILKNYGVFKKVFCGILKKVETLRPEAAILVDYPGFNLRLAKELKKRGVRVVYFISPQVWAWGKKRIAFIKRHVDLMLVLFKFEETLYSDGLFNVKFIGHPLLDIVRPSATRLRLLEEIGFKTNFKTIALLPGSREAEVQRHLGVMLEAARRIHAGAKDTQFLICRADTLPRQLFKDALDRTKIDFPYKILDNRTYDGLEASDFAIVASGTATLETAILNRPMVIIYKISALTYLLARMCVKIPHIGLVNVVAGEKIVPELIQFEATGKKIAETTLELLNDKAALEKIHVELYALKNTLGIPGASTRAASEIAKFLG